MEILSPEVTNNDILKHSKSLKQETLTFFENLKQYEKELNNTADR